MNDEDVLKLVDALCDGDENAYHTLIEADDDVVLTLVDDHCLRTDDYPASSLL